ncbi:MAG: hypothetical protein NkDv07_0279 [Candidatus Improbicoccus devescovinae]|nr:MAG: hypothetical protein NkDv07_0279 [Candidatus Improbicoccus devescovinae]
MVTKKLWQKILANMFLVGMFIVNGPSTVNASQADPPPSAAPQAITITTDPYLLEQMGLKFRGAYYGPACLYDLMFFGLGAESLVEFAEALYVRYGETSNRIPIIHRMCDYDGCQSHQHIGWCETVPGAPVGEAVEACEKGFVSREGVSLWKGGTPVAACVCWPLEIDRSVVVPLGSAIPSTESWPCIIVASCVEDLGDYNLGKVDLRTFWDGTSTPGFAWEPAGMIKW